MTATTALEGTTNGRLKPSLLGWPLDERKEVSVDCDLPALFLKSKLKMIQMSASWVNLFHAAEFHSAIKANEFQRGKNSQDIQQDGLFS